MLGGRMRTVRKEKGITLTELGEKIGKTASTLSRYEKNKIKNLDSKIVSDISKILEVSPAYLMGWTHERDFMVHADDLEHDGGYATIIVTDDDMAPHIPEGAMVKIRPLEKNEALEPAEFYYIEFNGRKNFRMAVDDWQDGLGFMPVTMSERRIAYDEAYVDIIGKAVSMKVLFERSW